MTLLFGPPGSGKTTSLLALSNKMDKAPKDEEMFMHESVIHICNFFGKQVFLVRMCSLLSWETERLTMVI